MEIRARYVLMGLFVLIVIAGGFGFVYWLQNTGGLGDRTEYRIRFEGSVSGLLLGSDVLFNGIRAGEVTALTLNPDDPRQVLVTIAVHADTPVRSDTEVALAFGGLTGVPSVALTGGSPDAAPVAALDGGLPLLIASQSATADWTQAARDAFLQVDTIFSDNADALKTTIDNLDIFAEALARNADGLDGIVAGLERMTGGAEGRKAPTIYELAAPNDFPPLAEKPAGQLVVNRPNAVVALDTQRILVTADGGMRPAFDGAQWSDSVPLLVQSALIQGFANAGFPDVANDMAGLLADHQLAIDLRTFRIDDDGPSPTAEVAFTAKVTDSANQIIASRAFDATAPVAAMDAKDAAAALNAAFQTTAKDAISWTLNVI